MTSLQVSNVSFESLTLPQLEDSQSLKTYEELHEQYEKSVEEHERDVQRFGAIIGLMNYRLLELDDLIQEFTKAQQSHSEPSSSLCKSLEELTARFNKLQKERDKLLKSCETIGNFKTRLLQEGVRMMTRQKLSEREWQDLSFYFAQGAEHLRSVEEKNTQQLSRIQSCWERYQRLHKLLQEQSSQTKTQFLQASQKLQSPPLPQNPEKPLLAPAEIQKIPSSQSSFTEEVFCNSSLEQFDMDAEVKKLSSRALKLYEDTTADIESSFQPLQKGIQTFGSLYSRANHYLTELSIQAQEGHDIAKNYEDFSKEFFRHQALIRDAEALKEQLIACKEEMTRPSLSAATLNSEPVSNFWTVFG